MASYGSVGGVEALVPSVGSLDTDTVPTSAQVTAWLAQGYAKINRTLASAGYVVPVNSGAAVYDELTALDNLFAATYVLKARQLDIVAGQDQNRADAWMKEFDRQLADLAKADLTTLGVTLSTTTPETGVRRRRLRTLQLRRTDGYSGMYEGATVEYPNTSE